jgi:hypothetical protein
MVLLDDIVDVRNGRTDEEGEDKCRDVMVGSPEVYVDGVEDTKEGEPPGNTIYNDTLANGEELVDDCAKKQDMDDSPDEEGPGSRSDVCFLGIVVDRRGPSNGVDVRAQEEEIYDDIDDFQEYSVFPGVSVVGYPRFLIYMYSII